MHGVIPLADPYGWNNGGAVMTLILPLGFFIVVMIALYFVFTRPHTVPGRRPIAVARPVAPDPQTARDMSAAVGFGTASSGGGTAPLADRGTPPVADRGTPPVAGARSEDNTASDDSAGDTAAGDTAAGDAGSTEGSEEQE